MLVGVASPSLIPALRNIGILLHEQATWIKHFCPECTTHQRSVEVKFGRYQKDILQE